MFLRFEGRFAAPHRDFFGAGASGAVEDRSKVLAIPVTPPAPAATFRAGCRTIMALCALCFSAVAAQATSYALAPGDHLSVFIPELSSTPQTVAIESDGSIELPWLGRFEAEGKPISELRQMVRQATEGQVRQRYSLTGEPRPVELNADSVQLSVATYRPVVLMGDVAQSGEHPFSPGLTVRAALALGGGIDLFGSASRYYVDPLQGLRIQVEYTHAIEIHADAAARLWSVDMRLAGERIEPPAAGTVKLSPERWEAVLADHERIAQVEIEMAERARAHATAALEAAEQRRSIVTRQLETAHALYDQDKAEENRATELLAKGLVRADRLDQVKRYAAQTAQQLLTIERNSSDIDENILELTYERDRFDSERRKMLQEERAAASLDLVRAEAALQSLTSQLVVAGAAPNVLDLDSRDILVQVAIYRREDGRIARRDGAMEDELLPGDQVEFTIDARALHR